MAYYSGATQVFPTLFPAPDASVAAGATLQNDGTNAFWAYPGATATTPLVGFQFRSIFTHGYLAGGYKGSNPWRALNRTWHATDVTLYCGEQLDRGGAYVDGCWSDNNGYVHATIDGFQAASTHTSSYSLATGLQRSRGESLNSPGTSGFGTPPATAPTGDGGWNLSVARTTTASANNDQQGQKGYITCGGSTVTDKFHFASEIMYVGTAGPVASGQAPSAHGQTYGWHSFAGTRYSLTYSSDAWTAASGTWWTAVVATDGACKILSTKLGWHYAGTGANVTIGFCKFSDSNGSSITSSLSKPRALGEENFQMGQNWGYCLGQYDGQQNNHTFKVTYSTDAILTLGALAQPKGHVGQSSGACSSAAASICGSNSAGGF